MFDPETQKLLEEVSDNVAGIARRIKSPKNDYNDLNVLSKALMDSSNTLFSVVLTEIVKKKLAD